MKLYVNGRYLSERSGGVYRYASEITSALKRENAEIVLLVEPGTDVPPAMQGINRITIGQFKGHTWEQVELPRWLRRHGSPLLLNFANRAPFLYRNQLVVIHDVMPIIFPKEYTKLFTLQFRFLLKTFTRALIPAAASEFSRTELSRQSGIDPERIRVIPSAADAMFARTPDASSGVDRKYILMVGDGSPHKNFVTGVAAHQRYVEEYSDPVELYIVTSRPEVVTNMVAEHGRSSLVRVFSGLSDRSLVELYQNAAAFVFPSIYEGFGIPPLEAQMAQVPVIAADIPAAREVLESSAVLCDPLSVVAFSDALHAIMSDCSVRSGLIAKGILNAKRYSWAASAQLVLDAVAEIRH